MDPYNLIKNIPFALESYYARKINERFGRRPVSSPYLSGDTYRSLADHIYDETNTSINFQKIQNGDIFFVSSWLLNDFFLKELPKINGSIVLISHQGDINIDESFKSFINSNKICIWFAQNAILKHEKIIPLPIGLEDQRRHYNGHTPDYKRLRKKNENKKNKILTGFTFTTNFDERIKCYKGIKDSFLIEEISGQINSQRYRKLLNKYKFVISPPGNGLDCHRTWEAMYLNVIPIVLRSSMTDYFYQLGLPIMLIDDWNEIRSWDESYLNQEYEVFKSKFNSKALWFEYWKNEIIKAKKTDLFNRNN